MSSGKETLNPGRGDVTLKTANGKTVILRDVSSDPYVIAAFLQKRMAKRGTTELRKRQAALRAEITRMRQKLGYRPLW
jgi:hypothetical protein